MKLTRLAMQTEMQASGFGTDTASVTRQNNWIDAAYMWVWNARTRSGTPVRWSFDRVDQATLAVVAGTAAPTMPSDFGKALWIEDDQGTPLRELDAESFDRTFAGDSINAVTGQPFAFKVVNRQVTLGPIPAATASYRWSYERRVAHFNVSDVATGGTFTVDTDYPLWPDHHMVVVFAAAAIGHALNSNPAAVTMEGLRDDALLAMRADLEVESAPGAVWGVGRGVSRGLTRSV